MFFWIVLFLMQSSLGKDSDPYEHVDSNHPLPKCNPYATDPDKQWGPHNILPNLYENVYRPFLDSFTYAVICNTTDEWGPSECHDVLEKGSLQERCAHVGANTTFAHYYLLVQYAWTRVGDWLPLPSNSNPALVTTTAIGTMCHTVVLKTDPAYERARECARMTTAYQCIWANAFWLMVPVAAVAVMSVFSLVVFVCVMCARVME
jgi:hypothetical protein